MTSNVAIKNGIRKLAYSKPGILIRDILGYKPAIYSERPYAESVSDAFFWRSDHLISTRFDIMNIPSQILPDEMLQDEILITIYSNNFEKLSSHQILLAPHTIKTIFIDDLVTDSHTFGFFTVFHKPLLQMQSWDKKTCISDRGYPSYKLKKESSVIWSYVHGCCNSHVLSYDFKTNQQAITCRRSLREETYNPQVTYDDCDHFELVFTNPLSTPVKMELITLYNNGSNSSQFIKLNSLETIIVPFNNSDRNISRTFHKSNVFAWRPLVFKYYSTHFDVFHS